MVCRILRCKPAADTGEDFFFDFFFASVVKDGRGRPSPRAPLNFDGVFICPQFSMPR